MLVSHRKKFIYTKTAKTGGTSVESYFEKYCMPEGEWTRSHVRNEHVSEAGIIGHRGHKHNGEKWFNHMPASLIRECIGEKVWSEYFKFTVIRNPFDKLISQFYFHILVQRKSESTSIPQGAEVKMFREWLSSGVKHLDRDKYFIANEVCVDKFIRYENLAADMRDVCDRLGVAFDADELPRFKSGIRSYHIPVDVYYDPPSKAIVHNLYGWELDYFKYVLPGK